MTKLSRDLVAGSILLVVGAMLLAIEHLPDVAFLIPFIVGLALLGVALLVRLPTALASGGVITGIGVGILVARQGSPDLGAAGLLLSIGGGFLAVTLLAALFDLPAVRSWPLVPGLALVALGAVIYAGGLGQETLDLASAWWPALLLVVGAYLILAARLRLPLYADEARGARDDETRPVGRQGHEDDQRMAAGGGGRDASAEHRQEA
jgi:hypothetical protein